MLAESGLIEIEPLTNSGSGGFIEIFKSPTRQDWANGLDELDLVDYTADEDGTGLILFVYKGKRNWIKTSVSKVPFSFLKKTLATMDPAFLDTVLLIRGTSGYPLSDKEVKTLASKINVRLKDTEMHFISSYANTLEEKNATNLAILENALKDIVEVLSYEGYDVAKKVEPDAEPKEVEELQSGVTSVVVNGITLTVQTKLTNENAPEEGLDYVSVRISSPEGKSLIYASTGFLNNSEEV
jgi:hypothetical protein